MRGLQPAPLRQAAMPTADCARTPSFCVGASYSAFDGLKSPRAGIDLAERSVARGRGGMHSAAEVWVSAVRRGGRPVAGRVCFRWLLVGSLIVLTLLFVGGGSAAGAGAM